MAGTERELPPTQAPAGARRTDALWLAGMSSILLLVLLPFSSYIASLPIIRDEWQMSNAQAAVVFSAYLIGYAVSSLVLVPLTDRISPERVLLISVFVIAASNLLFPVLARDLWSGSLLRLIAGAGHVGVYIPGIQLVSLRFPGSRRGTAVGIFVGTGYAGTTLSYIFMGQLLNTTDSWREAYFITALVGLIGVALAYFHMRGHATARATGERQAPKGRLNLEMLRDKSMVLVILAYALHTAELYLARLWLPLLLGAAFVQTGKAPLEAAALAATLSGVMFMMGIGGVFLGGMLSDYIGRSAGAAIIFFLSGACSFAAGWLVGVPPAFLIGLGFFYGFITAADSAIYSIAVVELAKKNRIGSTQAIQSFIGFGIGAIAPVAAGSILDVAASASRWGLAFSFNGALAVLGVGALLWLRRLPKARQMASGKR